MKANVGDLIQYRYRAGVFTNHDTRVVEAVDEQGYWVEGGYRVAPKDVLFVMPVTREATETVSQETGRPFPLEANQ